MGAICQCREMVVGRTYVHPGMHRLGYLLGIYPHRGRQRLGLNEPAGFDTSTTCTRSTSSPQVANNICPAVCQNQEATKLSPSAKYPALSRAGSSPTKCTVIRRQAGNMTWSGYQRLELTNLFLKKHWYRWPMCDSFLRHDSTVRSISCTAYSIAMKCLRYIVRHSSV